MSKNELARNPQSWAIPAVAALFGLAYLTAGVLSGDLYFGVAGLALMLAVGALFVVATRHSETARGLMDRRDERINAIDRDASLVAGMTVLLAVLVMFVVDIARGGSGSPYWQLGALGGLTYLLSLLWYRSRH
jgi:high-affinity Fe2+/Pb2+ permease